ncbi:MAG TPA: hypothetical protein VFA15_08615 [Nitrososphaera sp.]|nr:hypothetical protein [Nitrososphaera sp.]
MAKSVHLEQILRLSKALGESVKAHGEARVRNSEKAVVGLLLWLDYLEKSEATGCCNEILSGVRAAAVEATGGIALGLVRLAIFAMRSQIDLAVAWLFFKDHPVEWAHVLRTGEQFKLKKEIFSYLTDYQDRFSERLAMLERHRIRAVADPYRLLSAHIHGQSPLVIPTFSKLDALIYSEKRCAEAIKLQEEVAEYIGDISYLALEASGPRCRLPL